MNRSDRDTSIYSHVSLNKKLKDLRKITYGFSFGTVKEVCNQYGIKYEICNKNTKFTAPKSRLVNLVEKFHFSGVPYSGILQN